MSLQTHAVPGAATSRTRDRRTIPLIVLGLLGAQVLWLFCFAYPATHLAPRDLPVGVAGPPALTQQVASRLHAANAFDVRTYRDVDQARAAIRDREVYGAFVVAPPGPPRLLVAGAASPAVAQFLQGAASRLGRPAVEDVVPAAAKDPHGTALGIGLLPIVLTGLVAGAALALAGRGAMTQAGGVVAFSLLGGLIVTAILHNGMEVIGGDYWTLAAAFVLVLLALAASTAGVVRLAGRSGLALLAVLIVLVGNPGSGALNAPELLVEPWRTLGPYLPPGAGVTLVRNLAYFDGARTAGAIAVLAVWAAAGLLLLAVPLRRGRTRVTAVARSA